MDALMTATMMFGVAMVALLLWMAFWRGREAVDMLYVMRGKKRIFDIEPTMHSKAVVAYRFTLAAAYLAAAYLVACITPVVAGLLARLEGWL